MRYESYLIRKNLATSPNIDANLLFERRELKNLIKKISFKIFNLKAKPQILLIGGKGAGKTHFLKHFKSRIFHKYNIYPLEVDFVFTRNPYQLYSQIISLLNRVGCLEAFLEFIKHPLGLAELKKITNTHSCLSTVYIKFRQDINKLKRWITGELPNSGLNLPDIKNTEIEIDIITQILRYYHSIFTKQTYPILIGDHCETLVNDLITYVRSDEKMAMIRLLSRIIDISSCILAVNSNYVDEFKRILYPKSSNFEIYEIPPFNETDVNMFLSDMRNAFVRIERQEKVYEIFERETLNSELFPLTMQAHQYLQSLTPLQPSELTNMLQKALEFAINTRGTYFIMEKDLKQVTLEYFPTLLYKCSRCNKRLKMILVEVRDRGYGKPGRVEKVLCPECKEDCLHLLPLVLDIVVLDSSALVNFDFSATYKEMIKQQHKRPKVIVPSAVMSEMSAWEKKKEKRDIYIKARQEFQRLISLNTEGKIRLLTDVGRKPTLTEIKEAAEFNSIDRIIVDVARVHNATLMTRDKGMVINSVNKVRFIVLSH